MAQACNPSTLGGRGRWITRWRDWDHPGQHGEIPPLQNKTKQSWSLWLMLVVSAAQEAEAGGSLEPRSLKLQWAMIAPLHSRLGDKARPCRKKKKKQKRKENFKDFRAGKWHHRSGSQETRMVILLGDLESLTALSLSFLIFKNKADGWEHS